MGEKASFRGTRHKSVTKDETSTSDRARVLAEQWSLHDKFLLELEVALGAAFRRGYRRGYADGLERGAAKSYTQHSITHDNEG